jgi:hypothetical protein
MRTMTLRGTEFCIKKSKVLVSNDHFIKWLSRIGRQEIVAPFFSNSYRYWHKHQLNGNQGVVMISTK